MKELTNEAFARYGSRVEIGRGEAMTQAKAFIQPLRKESGEEPFAATELGAVDEQCWRYLGPAETEIAMGDCVISEGRRFTVRRAAPFYVGETIAYYWAILRPEGSV